MQFDRMFVASSKEVTLCKFESILYDHCMPMSTFQQAGNTVIREASDEYVHLNVSEPVLGWHCP